MPKRFFAASAAVAAAFAGTLLLADPAAATMLPAPAVDVPRAGGTQVAIFAGGCFWGMEGLFEQVKGVKSVTSGYAGGAKNTATYDQVSTETTGHAESVRIVYDPAVVSYGTLSLDEQKDLIDGLANQDEAPDAEVIEIARQLLALRQRRSA